MDIGPGSLAVIVVRWTERGEFKEQAYGPVTLGERDTDHWPQVVETMHEFEREHPEANWTNSTFYVLAPPAPAPAPATP